jgi:hypothetical protein
LDVARLVVESIIGLLGLYLVHSFRRQQRLRIADLRIPAYQRLWELMKVAAPSRVTDSTGAGSLAPEEARELHHSLWDWYWQNGNGMFLTDETQKIWAAALDRLRTYGEDGGIDPAEEGWRRIVELSLLRTQMKRDIKVYGVAVAFGSDLTAQLSDSDRREGNDLREAAFRRDFVLEKNLEQYLRIPRYTRVGRNLKSWATRIL